MATKKITTTVNKSAVDGRFVSTGELKKHPKTTFKQTVEKAAKRPSKKG